MTYLRLFVLRARTSTACVWTADKSDHDALIADLAW